MRLTEMVQTLVPGSTVLSDDRTVLPSTKELDIVVPDHHLAIEFNDIFSHSEQAVFEKHAKPRPHSYHADKTREAHEQGYQLIHVWEDDWLHRRELVMRACAHRLHAVDRSPDVLPDINPLACERLYARKLTVRTVHTWTSWSDNDISDGGMYQVAGFTPDKRQGASYSYVEHTTRWERVHRSTYTKQRFIDDPDLVYEPGQTEHEAALANRLYRIYDAGKTRWIKHVER